VSTGREVACMENPLPAIANGPNATSPPNPPTQLKISTKRRKFYLKS
jgi:hypothetical protein